MKKLICCMAIIATCLLATGISLADEEIPYSEELLNAAKKGDAMAQRNLGFCYENGTGVQQDLEKAVEWYTKAAEQGYAMAQNDLGFCYESGTGVQQDLARIAVLSLLCIDRLVAVGEGELYLASLFLGFK
jgi:TPR repeat protein